MSQPIRTTSGKQIIEALDAQVENAQARLAELRSRNLDECDTFTRQGVALRIAKLDAGIESMQLAQGIVRGLLPYVETDAVQRAQPGISLGEAEFLLGDPEQMYDPCPRHPLEDRMHDCPDDPTLPFVMVPVAAAKGAHL